MIVSHPSETHARPRYAHRVGESSTKTVRRRRAGVRGQAARSFTRRASAVHSAVQKLFWAQKWTSLPLHCWSMHEPPVHSVPLLQSWHWPPVTQSGRAAGHAPAWHAVVSVNPWILYEPQQFSPAAQSACAPQWKVASFAPHVAVAPWMQIAASRPPSEGTQVVQARGSQLVLLHAAAAPSPLAVAPESRCTPAPDDEPEPLDPVELLELLPPGPLPDDELVPGLPASSPAGESLPVRGATDEALHASNAGTTRPGKRARNRIACFDKAMGGARWIIDCSSDSARRAHS
jgi:hypothetical protein